MPAPRASPREADVSFILDALKKSENERQKASGPALFEVKVAPPASRFPMWAVVVGVLLGVNLVVLIAVLLLRDQADPAVQATNAQIAANAAAQAAAGSAPGVGAPSGGAASATTAPGAATAPAGPAPGSAPPAAAQATLGPDGLPVAGAGPGAPPAGPSRFNTPLVEEDPTLAEEPAYGPRGAPINPADYQPATAGQTPPLASPGAYGPAAGIGGGSGTAQGPSYPPGGANPGAGPARSPGSAQTSGVPSRDDLVAAGQGGIPEANVSLHVYDKNPAARFVFVNGQRAKEGDVLANGIRVDEIRADGAVLSFRGARFLVPIQ
jgi:general secretion pathway protein B